MHKIISSFMVLGIGLLCGVGSLSAATATSSATSTSAVVGHDAAVVEAHVRAAFPDDLVMVDVARCESNFRQFTDAGSVFRGGTGGEMVGVFQFYETVHSATARALGFDLATLEGNIGYARYVYEQSGTRPWSPCVPPVAALGDDQTKVKIELLKQVIVLLQKLLVLKQAEM